MNNAGAFGYIIGKKKRIMYVNYDSDLLWQVLVREIYVLMKHFQSKELLKNAFEKIKPVKNKPKPADIDKCKIFTDFDVSNHHMIQCEWSNILRYCQSSYINLLESGYIINDNSDNKGFIFMLDFNKGIATYYRKTFNGIIQILNTATIEEIMEFDEMPTKSYNEIVSEMTIAFNIYYLNLEQINGEIDKITNIINEAKKQCSYNIADKAQKLLSDMNYEKTKLNVGRRVFYNRLTALDLIEHSPREK